MTAEVWGQVWNYALRYQKHPSDEKNISQAYLLLKPIIEEIAARMAHVQGYRFRQEGSCHYLRLVDSIPEEKLEPLAKEGIIQAFDTFRPERGARFAPYVKQGIAQVIFHASRESSGCVQVPYRKRGDPTFRHKPLSIESLLLVEDGAVYVSPECLVDERNPEIEALEREQRNKIFEALSTLPKEQQVAIWRHYFMGETRQEIGKKVGASPDIVHRDLRRARRHLHASAPGLRDYLTL